MKRSSRIEREGEYVAMPAWLAGQAARENCEVCRIKYGTISGEFFVLAKQVIDHIFPVRFLLSLHLDPHMGINTLSCCGSCHGKKLHLETRIFAGDVLGFLQGIRMIGYPIDRVQAAAAHYGFTLWPIDHTLERR